MIREEWDEVLIASLRFSPVGALAAELAATDAAQELVKTWNVGHPGGFLSLTQNDR